MSEWRLGDYDGREVLSALRKSIVLGDTEAGLYWVNVCLTYGGKGGQRLVAKQLWIAASEVVDDPLVLVQAALVLQQAGTVPETDPLFFLTARMCRARKWFESSEGREVDRLWSKAIGDLKDPPRRRQIPEWALDRHTRRGWERRRESGWFDDRFSGTDLGRAKTAYLFERDGELSVDAEIDADFWPVWRRRRELQADDLPDPEPDDAQGRLL